jgi:hypothetical protein
MLSKQAARAIAMCLASACCLLLLRAAPLPHARCVMGANFAHRLLVWLILSVAHIRSFTYLDL